MKHTILHEQAQRETHTPAICDSNCRIPETHANSGFSRSTALNQPVHIRGPLATPPSVQETLDKGMPQ